SLLLTSLYALTPFEISPGPLLPSQQQDPDGLLPPGEGQPQFQRKPRFRHQENGSLPHVPPADKEAQAPGRANRHARRQTLPNNRTVRHGFFLRPAAGKPEGSAASSPDGSPDEGGGSPGQCSALPQRYPQPAPGTALSCHWSQASGSPDPAASSFPQQHQYTSDRFGIFPPHHRSPSSGCSAPPRLPGNLFPGF